MILVLGIIASVTAVGWINEIIYRKRLFRGIQDDIKREIGWIKFANIDREEEIEAFEECLRIIDDYV